MSDLAPEVGSIWRNIAMIFAAVVVTVFAADFLLRTICPPIPPKMEFSDGFSEFVSGKPNALVLGSSHARAYVALQKKVSQFTSGQVHLSVLPLEWGKLSSYQWAIENRIAPYLEQDRSSANPQTSQLRHLLLVTEWWDGCSPDNGRAVNIPARAWTLKHFVSDVIKEGLTDFNRSYLTSQWSSLWRWTILWSDRGIGRLPRALWARAKGAEGLETPESYQGRIIWWQNMTEGAFEDPNCKNGKELEALDHIVEFTKKFNLELTVVLHPRMPSTLTVTAKSTTLNRFANELHKRAVVHGFRIVDATVTSPLQDNDFMSDFDHVTEQGSVTLADWALSSGLSFLLTLAEPATQRHP
ncbi:MAG: hypothetical protein HUU55_09555 [Myxococcales bacterium]|nr:hypothetical protein [Myxococcales bacterium]